MKRRLSWFTVFLVIVLIASACAKPAATPAPTPVKAPPVATPAPATPAPGMVATPRPVARPAPAPEAKPTGELRVALHYTGTESMDPSQGPGSMQIFMSYPYDWLIGVDEEGKLSPELSIASKWEPSADFKKWTINLKQGIKFHNGDEVTSDDVKFTIEKMMNPDAKNTFTSTFRKKVDRIETPDPYTVVFYLKEPWGIMDYYLSPLNQGMEGIVLPREYIQRVGDEQFNRNPLGTGAFKFVEHQVGSFAQFEAVDRHWRIGVPPYKRLYIMIMPEEATRVAAIKIGQADIAEVSKDTAFELEKEGVRVISRETAYVTALHFHQQWEEGPFADQRVRRALTLAINREEIAELALRGQASVPTESPNHPAALGYNPQRKQHYPYDPAEAKRLLKEAGWDKGFEVNLWAFPRPGLPEIVPVFEAVASYWEKLGMGIKTKIIPMDYGGFRPLYRTQKLPPNSVSTITLPPVAFPFVYYNLMIAAGSPFRLVDAKNHPELESLRQEASRAVSAEEYADAMRRLIDQFHKEDIWPPFLYLNQPFAVSDKVDTWTIRPIPYSLSLDLVTLKK